MVRMPGFGLDGPWRDNPAFAFVIEDAAGLTWMTGHADETPISPYCVGDSNAGSHALCGLLLALEHRSQTGEGVVVDASMVDAALNVAAEQVVEHSAYGALLGRDGNRGPTAAPQNLYLTADADERRRPRRLGGDSRRHRRPVAGSARRARSARHGRWTPLWPLRPGVASHHDEIDDHLSRWCGERSGDEIVDCLWGADVPVAKVLQPHEQATIAPAAVPRLLRGGRPAAHGDGPAQHRAVPLLTRPQPVPPPPRPVAGRAHRRGAARPRGGRRGAGRASRARSDRQHP